jgi:16S rRNA (uracil1498-N3)-methyltransferase
MSFIPRLFLPTVPENQHEINLDESASRYLVKVLRFTEGSIFKGFDSQGCRYELALKKTDAKQSTASVLVRHEKNPVEAKVSIALGQSLPKAAKMDLILRQATEAGVNRFIPLVTQRSVSRPDVSQYGHKSDRWQKILMEACRQCGRNDVPQLDSVTDWPEAFELFGQFDQVLLPYEKEAPTLKTVLESNPSAGKILVLVGPEGGWAKEEVREAEERGATPVHLPTPILRTETAGIAIVSMIQFFYGSTPDGSK